MSDQTHPVFRLEMRAFIPGQKLWGFYGDNRGFGPSTNGSSRLHASVELSPQTAAASGLRSYSDPTQGPMGAQARATPSATIATHPIAQGAAYDLRIAGANPLLPGAPDIDLRAQVSISQPTPNTIKVTAKLSGDKFPATELWLYDASGQPMFLGGLIPDRNASPTRLVGNRDLPISEVELVFTFDKNQNVARIVSAELTGGPSGPIGNKHQFGGTYTPAAWSRTATQALTPDGMPAPEHIPDRPPLEKSVPALERENRGRGGLER